MFMLAVISVHIYEKACFRIARPQAQGHTYEFIDICTLALYVEVSVAQEVGA
jgi:hypothetical protein